MSDIEETSSIDDGSFHDDDEYGEDYMFDALSALLSTEDGDNVCTALMSIKDSIDTTNKILLKMLDLKNKKE